MMPRFAVRVYGWLPRSLSNRIVRLVNPSYLIGVVAVVFDEEGRVLVLRHTYHQPPWRLPGGLLDKGEQHDEAAVRETSEEASCEIVALQVVDAYVGQYSFDVAVLGRLVKVHPFEENPEVCERRFVGREEWGILRHEQRRFVEAAWSVWKHGGHPLGLP